jgi:beta-galactosidase GanA
LDIFQKIKAIGFNTVSFYVDWALVEGKQGDFSAEGVFDLEPFFEAAKEAGIYLIAVRCLDTCSAWSYVTDRVQRPGPYINAESSGGGTSRW